jgi:hypothetical protein
MAIANFQTGGTTNVSTGSNSGSGSSTKTILIAALLIGAAYLGYKYWYLPKKEKDENK